MRTAMQGEVGVRLTISRMTNPAPGTGRLPILSSMLNPGTIAGAVTDSAGLREASAASGAGQPRVIRAGLHLCSSERCYYG